MTVQKRMIALEELIQEVTDLNELVSRLLAYFVENKQVHELQQEIMERDQADRQKSYEIESQLWETCSRKRINIYQLSLKQKIIVQKYNKLKKPFIPMNTLEFICLLDDELKSINDDLPERILKLTAYNFDPLLLNRCLGSYLQDLIYGYFKMNKLQNDESAICDLFKYEQDKAKKFIDEITGILAKSDQTEMKYYYGEQINPTFLRFIELNFDEL